jgi:hypothetical protein
MLTTTFRQRITARGATAIAAATMAGLVLVGCSSGSSSSKSDDTQSSVIGNSNDPVCVAARKLEKTIVGLTRPGLLTSGRAGINDAADKVKQSLLELRKTASSSLKPDIDDLNDSVDQLRGAASNFGNGSLTENLQRTSQAIRAVSSSAQGLVAAIRDTCPLPGSTG